MITDVIKIFEDSSLLWLGDFKTELDAIWQSLNKEQQDTTEITLISEGYDYPSLSIKISCNREETLAEKEERIKIYNYYKEKNERELLKQLQEKYNVGRSRCNN